jgi:hypothetical protein
MAKCLRCKKEFECGSGYTCQECIDRIAKIIKADVEKNQRAREINDRFEILDL